MKKNGGSPYSELILTPFLNTIREDINLNGQFPQLSYSALFISLKKNVTSGSYNRDMLKLFKFPGFLI